MNILMLTSCNRIKQTLLSLSINAQVIKQPFAILIIDCSTPELDATTACNMHDISDPYNVVKEYNYCSDVQLLYDAAKFFPQALDYKVIHISPRLQKQQGEATMVAVGLQMAAMMGNRQDKGSNFVLKLTGTSILKFDVFSELPQRLANADIMTMHRANIGGPERTTRIFGCRPENMCGVFAKHGYMDYVEDLTGIYEQRIARIINADIPDRIFYTGEDENTYLLEGGQAMQESYGRDRITHFIQQQNIDTNATPWLKEFVEGGIWSGGIKNIFKPLNPMSFSDFIQQYKNSRPADHVSDKFTDHAYEEVYEAEFSGKAELPLKIVEIGIGGGQSLRMWTAYFKNADITALEFHKDHYGHNPETGFQCPPAKSVFVDAYLQSSADLFEDNSLDYLLEDGNHTPENQTKCIQLYFKKLKIGGKMIIEDMRYVELFQEFEEVIKQEGFVCETKHYDLRSKKNRHDDIVMVITRLA